MGKAMNQNVWHICTVIPARNEEELIAECLESVLKASRNLLKLATFEILVGVDSSQDKTAKIAQTIIGKNGVVIELNERNVGSVRRIISSRAIAPYLKRLSSCWIANTDADSIVPDSWLTHQLHHASNDILAIAGIIDVGSFSEYPPEIEDIFRLSYTLNDDGSHPHIHGANFGVRADAYVEAGGWPAIKTSEDHALWHALTQLGVSKISDSSLKVLTSGRRNGRAPNGFATALSAHEKNLQ